MRLLALTISLLVSTALYAQTITISGKIIDAVDKESIKGVVVTSGLSDNVLAKTDEEGVYSFSFTYSEEVYLKFRHVGFNPQRILINRRKMRRVVDDTLYINLQLEFYELPAVNIMDPAIPDTVFGDVRLSVSDFLFTEDNRLLMLAYEQTLRRGSKIILANNDQTITDSVIVPGRARGLFQDYVRRKYVVCEEGVFQLEIFGNDLRMEEIEEEHFYKFIVPIIDTANAHIYYSNYNPDYPAFEYFAYNSVDSSSTPIVQVEDKLLMELYRSEYKYVDGAEKLWAFRQELKTGIDKEIWIGLKYFTNSIYYKSLYAPLFVIDEEVVVFDHYSDQVLIYGEDHKLLDSLQIYYHKMKGKQEWDNLLIQDEENETVYTILHQGGYKMLAEIDLNTGRLGAVHKLYYKYVENVRVRNGEAYYIYRPFESAQKKFLYKERLGEES